MSSRNLTWTLCAACGLATVAVALLLLPMFPSEGAHVAAGYGKPVMAFEMARSAADLLAVFGPPGDPARAARIAAMDRGNRWDYLFLATYSSFIASFFIGAARSRGRGGWLLFAAIGVVAGLADAAENWILLGLTSDLEATAHLALLRYPVWLKFGGLMVAGVAAGAFLLSSCSAGFRVLGAIATLAALCTLLMMWAPARYAALATNGLAVCWLAQLVFALTEAIRERRQEETRPLFTWVDHNRRHSGEND